VIVPAIRGGATAMDSVLGDQAAIETVPSQAI
jgi:hypothetical protein